MAKLIGMPLPLLPLQILWVNLVTDGLPGLALAAEKAERNVMERPPRPPAENIFARGLGVDLIWIGLTLGALSLASGYFHWASGVEDIYWRTMIFTTLTFSQMGNALACRSEQDSLFRIGIFSNMYMIGAVLLTILLQLLVVYLPFLQDVFDTTPLALKDLGWCAAASVVLFAAVESVKAVRGLGKK